MVQKPKVYLFCGICTAIATVALLAFGIFTAAFIGGFLKSKAASQVAMTSATYADWGQIPGGYKANVTRRYTFFNFTNPFEVFYFNDPPVFTELSSQLYAENQNLLSPDYSDEDSDGAARVDFGFQLFMTPIAASPTDQVTTLNLGPLGFWYSAPRLPDSQLASYAMAALMESLELDVVTTLQSAAIQFQCTPDYETAVKKVLNISGITDPELQSLIWNDPVNGLGTLSTLAQWVHAIADGQDSGAAKILGDYFYLSYAQLTALFAQGNALYTCVNALNSTVSNGYDCSDDPCDPHYFVQLQWATQRVTADPPDDVLPAEASVTFFNDTVDGFPEISYYLSDYFLVNEPVNQTDYENVTWTVDMAKSLLNYTTFDGPADDYCTAPDTLLHMGNMAFLYQYGEAFDALNDTSDLTPLQPIQLRFNLPSLQHAHVLWKYVLYFQTQLAMRQYMNGTAHELILGQFVSSSLYQNFIAMQDFIPFDLTARIIMSNITAAGVDCVQLFTNSIAIITPQEAESYCQSPYLSSFNISVIKTLYIACNSPNGPEYNELYDNLHQQGMPNKGRLATFCITDSNNSFVSFMQFSQTYMKKLYNCSASYQGATRCSNSELAVMQWGQSLISQNVPEMLTNDFKPSDSISDWYPEIVPQPFEYVAVLKKLGRLFENNATLMQPLSFEVANQLLTFNTLFDEVIVQVVFLSWKNQDWAWFEGELYGVSPYPLVTYLRYVMMEISLGGFYQTRNVSDLLWGYEDPLLTQIKGKSPYYSGDPSLNNVVTLAGPNCTDSDSTLFSASMYTGTNDSSLTRRFISINDIPTITFNNTYFNGNESTYELISPWGENITFNGTDGVINGPGLETTDNVSLFISDLSFQSQLTYSGENQDYSGLTAYRYVLPTSAMQSAINNPDNAKWFMDKWDGLINISMMHKAPLFVSKGHYLDVPSEAIGNVMVYTDSSMTTNVTATDADNLFLDIEPYSGGAVGTMASLQINYEFSQDPLFGNASYSMLPILLTQRGMSFTSDQVSDVYGQLLLGLKLKQIGPMIFFPLAFVFALLTIFLFVRRRNMMKKKSLIAEEGSYNRMLPTENATPNRPNPLEGYVSSGNNIGDESVMTQV